MDSHTMGILALCGTMVGVLVWIIKEQSKTIQNHLRHLQSAVDSLPCKTGVGCPVEGEE